MIEYALRDLLVANQLVYNLVAGRIYPVRIPREELMVGNKITYRRKSGGRGNLISGADGHPYPRFEIMAWSPTYDGAKELADAVRKTLDGYSGEVNEIDIRLILNTDEEDGFVGPEDGSDDGLFFVMLEYAIRYTEAA